MTKVLLVDDDKGIVDSLKLYLEQSGFDIYTCMRGDEAIDTFHQTHPDIVILDINLPGKDGIQIIRELREVSEIPVLMLSARDDQRNIIESLELGADDYVSKPFSPREIVMRLQAILRRWGIKSSAKWSVYKDIRLVEDDLAAHRDGNKYDFTKSEFYILKRIIEWEGSVVTREELMHEIMGYSNYVYDRTIDTHVKNIRKKIWEDVIQTVRGIGYKSF